MDEINKDDLNVSVNYDPEYDYFVRNVHDSKKRGTNLYELISTKKFINQIM